MPHRPPCAVDHRRPDESRTADGRRRGDEEEGHRDRGAGDRLPRPIRYAPSRTASGAPARGHAGRCRSPRSRWRSTWLRLDHLAASARARISRAPAESAPLGSGPIVARSGGLPGAARFASKCISVDPRQRNPSASEGLRPAKRLPSGVRPCGGSVRDSAEPSSRAGSARSATLQPRARGGVQSGADVGVGAVGAGSSGRRLEPGPRLAGRVGVAGREARRSAIFRASSRPRDREDLQGTSPRSARPDTGLLVLEQGDVSSQSMSWARVRARFHVLDQRLAPPGSTVRRRGTGVDRSATSPVASRPSSAPIRPPRTLATGVAGDRVLRLDREQASISPRIRARSARRRGRPGERHPCHRRGLHRQRGEVLVLQRVERPPSPHAREHLEARP